MGFAVVIVALMIEKISIMSEIEEFTICYTNNGDVNLESQEVVWYSSLSDTISMTVQSGDRVSQMTKTYNDIDAVTRLLEEKEKDLELAARIGQKLLQKCQALEQKNEILEEEQLLNRDQITQLKHDLSTKTDLLRILQNNEYDHESECGEDIPVNQLQRKIKELEEENLVLAEKTKSISLETETLEGQELQLIHDFKERLVELNLDSKRLSDDLYSRIEECNKQQEDLTHLLAQVADFQSKNKQLRLENEELYNHLQAAKECQNDLTTELVDFKEKYQEIVELLHDAQQQLRSVRNKSLPTVGRQGFYSPYVQFDSLAAELESSISGESGNFNPTTRQLHNLKVFETVRSAKQKTNIIPNENNPSHLPHLYGGPTVHQSALAKGSICSVTAPKESSRTDRYFSHRGNGRGGVGGIKTPLDSAVASDSEGSGSEDVSYVGYNSLGRPGVPGSDDLETALQRLSLQRQSDNEYHIHSRHRMNEEGTPAQCRTPDSIMSTGSGYSAFSGLTSASGYAFRHYHIPEKLQIVKPMEGSATLHQWQQLATPHLGGIFEERPGVQIKGEKKLEEIDEHFKFGDIEEDEEMPNPGKLFDTSSLIYTYTDSKVLHPDELTVVTPSGMQSTSSSWVQGRERATSTFSTTLSLAKVLQERNLKSTSDERESEDVKEESSEAEAVDMKDPFPSTPYNSPIGSPPGSPFFSPLKVPGLAMLSSYLSRGAELLGVSSTDHVKHATKSSTSRDRVKQPGMPSSMSVNSGLSNINLVGRINKIGIDNVVQNPKPNVNVGISSNYKMLSGGYTQSKLSPMTQLTSLRNLNLSKTTTSSSAIITTTTTVGTTTTSSAADSNSMTSGNLNLPSSTPILNRNVGTNADVYHELGNIDLLGSFRKGGFL
ncbi:hypothetical protein CHUAL_001163 [Chamberlinius hualienensis]